MIPTPHLLIYLICLIQVILTSREFDWKLPTEEIISRAIDSLKVYFSEGQLEHVKSQLPARVKDLDG